MLPSFGVMLTLCLDGAHTIIVERHCGLDLSLVRWSSSSESDARGWVGRLDDHGDEEAALAGAGRAEVDDHGSVVVLG
jgi:hypothetical protein